jgi:5-formyltetrahydrofolate cyclo-ligase
MAEDGPLTTKAELRAKMLALREALSSEDVARRSASIRRRVLEVAEVKAARSVFTYVSAGGEVDTRGIIEALLKLGKIVSVPLIIGNGIMEACRIRGLEDLAPGKFGILAPRTPSPVPAPPDVCLCPGVAFTARGERLGRGKAYYDRFLDKYPGLFAVGLGYEIQVVEEIPTEPSDRRVRCLVTEDRTIIP